MSVSLKISTSLNSLLSTQKTVHYHVAIDISALNPSLYHCFSPLKQLAFQSFYRIKSQEINVGNQLDMASCRQPVISRPHSLLGECCVFVRPMWNLFHLPDAQWHSLSDGAHPYMVGAKQR